MWVVKVVLETSSLVFSVRCALLPPRPTSNKDNQRPFHRSNDVSVNPSKPTQSHSLNQSNEELMWNRLFGGGGGSGSGPAEANSGSSGSVSGTPSSANIAADPNINTSNGPVNGNSLPNTPGGLGSEVSGGLYSGPPLPATPVSSVSNELPPLPPEPPTPNNLNNGQSSLIPPRISTGGGPGATLAAPAQAQTKGSRLSALFSTISGGGSAGSAPTSGSAPPPPPAPSYESPFGGPPLLTFDPFYPEDDAREGPLAPPPATAQKFLNRHLHLARAPNFQQFRATLDLARITDSVLACGMIWRQRSSPESRRVNQRDLSRFLAARYPGRYMIFNLAWGARAPPTSAATPAGGGVLSSTMSAANAGTLYDYSEFGDQVVSFQLPDGDAPTHLTLRLLFDIVRAMYAWIHSGPDQVAIVHCTDGIGRTGTAIAAYLAFVGQVPTGIEALEYFLERRLGRGKSEGTSHFLNRIREGVTGRGVSDVFGLVPGGFRPQALAEAFDTVHLTLVCGTHSTLPTLRSVF